MDIRPYIYTSMLIIAYFLIFRKVRKNPLILVFYLYLASSIAGTFLDYDYIRIYGWEPEEFSVGIYMLYSSCIIGAMLPIRFLRGFSADLQSFPKRKNIQYFLLFWSLLAIFSITWHAPYVLNTFTTGADEIRHLLNRDKKSILPISPLTTVAVAVAAFYNVFIFLFFQFLTHGLKYKKILIFCFLSSMTYIISSLTFGARDGMIFFLLASGAAFNFYEKNYPQKLRKRIRNVFIIGGSLLILTLGSFTYQRFFKNSDRTLYKGIQAGVLGYFGQQPYVFNEAVLTRRKNPVFYGHSLRFPILNPILGEVEGPPRTKPVEYTFGSFVKDFYDVGGFPFLILAILVIMFYFSFHFRRWRLYHPIRNIVLISFYWQFMVSGLFFFNLGSFAGNIVIIVYLLVFHSLKLVYPNRRINRQSSIPLQIT
jgi:oligosaccharide repeat unit polymerase